MRADVLVKAMRKADTDGRVVDGGVRRIVEAGAKVP